MSLFEKEKMHLVLFVTRMVFLNFDQNILKNKVVLKQICRSK
jgi:hypothetical protein